MPIKKIGFSLVAMLFVAVNLHAQSPGCKLFRDGKFKMTYKGKQTIIIRKGYQQLQYFDKAKQPTVYTVKWVNDCTFTLTPERKRIAKLKDVPLTAVLTQKIIKAKKDSYTQVTSANFTKRTITGEIYKIK